MGVEVRVPSDFFCKFARIHCIKLDAKVQTRGLHVCKKEREKENGTRHSVWERDEEGRQLADERLTPKLLHHTTTRVQPMLLIRQCIPRITSVVFLLASHATYRLPTVVYISEAEVRCLQQIQVFADDVHEVLATRRVLQQKKMHSLHEEEVSGRREAAAADLMQEFALSFASLHSLRQNCSLALLVSSRSSLLQSFSLGTRVVGTHARLLPATSAVR